MDASWQKLISLIPEGICILDNETKNVFYINEELKRILKIESTKIESQLVEESMNSFIYKVAYCK